MTDIRKSLDDLANAIEDLQKKPNPEPNILDRGLSGDKIYGGTITKFGSSGITDEAKNKVLVVKDNGIHVDTIYTKSIAGGLSVDGNLSVKGTVTAEKMHVNEVTADIRHERSDPLSFTAKGGRTAYGKGIVFPGGEYTKQFILQERPDRFFATESVELRSGKIYMINGQNVLAQDELGRTVTKSHLKSVGILEKLEVESSLTVDNYLFYDANTQRLGLGTETPNAAISLASWDHEFIIDPTDDRGFKLGSYTTTGVDIITDNTVRIAIDLTGQVTIKEKTIFKNKIGVGVNNFVPDVDITTAGPVRFQNKKFEVSDSEPESGNYKKGDIIWNSDPKPTGYVGWICTTSGTPGNWKPFGQIAS